MSVFSPGESKVGITTWGLCIARDGPESYCWCVLKAWLTILTEFEGFLCADDFIFDLCRPYIERLPTL